MRVVSLLASLAVLLLTVTPVAANPNERGGGWGGDRSRDGGGHRGEHGDRSDRGQRDKDSDRDGWGQRVSDSDWGRDCNDDRRGHDDDDDDDDDDNGRVRWDGNDGGRDCDWGDRGRRGVFQNRGDGLHDDQADALSDVLQDCVSKENLRDMRWGQLWQLVHTIGLTPRERQKIHDLGDLADALADHLDDNDVQDLKFKQILQVAHSCSLSTRDVVEILRSA